jgi:hypothetical protein
VASDVVTALGGVNLGQSEERWASVHCKEAGSYNRPISVYCFPRRALKLCPQFSMGIQPGVRFPARSADALPATLYRHYTQAIYRNRHIVSFYIKLPAVYHSAYHLLGCGIGNCQLILPLTPLRITITVCHDLMPRGRLRRAENERAHDPERRR